MRDLASRLRAIVQTNGGLTRRPGAGADPTRELTYVPDLPGLRDHGLDLDRVAEALGGRRHDVSGSGCVVIDRRVAPWQRHGHAEMASYAGQASAGVAVLDPRLVSSDAASGRVVFFDIETTGLSGGAGTLAFLAGGGWFDDDGGFTVRQAFLTGPAGERAMLDVLEDLFSGASMLVTYNGRTFDVPVMEMRWAFHRRSMPIDDLPHLDLLPAARRLWGTRAPAQDEDHDRGEHAGAASCSLGALERSVIGFHRLGDVPGFEIPTRYFQFLRFGDADAISGVLDHNRHDIVSLAAVAGRAAILARDGHSACATDAERCGLGRLYERAACTDRAIEAYAAASASADRDTRRQALSRLAILMARADRHDDAARAWQGVLDLANADARFGPIERRAAEALAIHHEHRLRDLDAAQRYATALERDGRARRHVRAVDDAAHRLARLDRKLARANSRGGHMAAPLLTDS